MKLNIRSLAFLTDLSILAFDGHVVDRGSYYLAETPDNPDFFWGNLLLMRHPPQSGDLDLWISHFKKEFAHQPMVKHMTFGWDSPQGDTGDIEPFLKAGFEFEQSVILTAEQQDIVPPTKINSQVEIRPLETDQEWEVALTNQVACRRPEFGEERYYPFKKKQMLKYRRMSEAGLGHWYGAFFNNRLVADCGLFSFQSVGRYQSVATHPEFRRRGICGALIYNSARHLLSSGKANQLVMAADPNYHAARIYKSVGFNESEKQVGVYWWPKEEWTN